MKKFIQTIQNIYKIEDLRKRIFYTLGLILIYRLGSFIVLPGIDPDVVNSLANQSDDGTGGLFGLINMFAGGAFNRASIFALGIMPYISASIILQLLTMTMPQLQKMQKEGESGRRKINDITRVLTIGITFFQAIGYCTYLLTYYNEAIILRESTFYFYFLTIIVLTSGTIFIMWLGEKITDRGIGNGISLLIMIGIIATLPAGITQEISMRLNDQYGLVPFFLEIVFLVAVIAAVVLLVQGVRKVPLHFARQMVGNRGNVNDSRSYLPLKVNAANVMPIIFAQAIMLVPGVIAQFGLNQDEAGPLQTFFGYFQDPSSFIYNLTVAILVIVFTYFYTAIILNPMQMADDLKKSNAFIPGVKPGKPTADYIDSVLSRIMFPGALFLALITILPAFASQFGVNQIFAQFFGGTSLIIMVGVVLDTLQQIESHLLMRHYDGLTQTGRVKGRSTVGASV